MNYLYEYSDTLNRPFEVFMFDTAVWDFPVRSHWHHYVELIYMIEGSIIATVNEREYYLNEGDMILFYNGDIHSLSDCTYQRAVFIGIKFDASRLTVNAGITPKLATMLRAAREQKARVYFGEEDGALEFVDYFRKCLDESREAAIGYDVAIQARLCLLFLSLIRIWQAEGVDFNNLTQYLSEEEVTINNILEYIDMHIDDNLRVEDLAKHCNMSYSHFAKSFREMYGRTCKEHLEMLRVEKAEEMLKFTDYSLSDIAQELGYSDSSHFIREFKKHKGVTPGSVR